MRDLGFRVARAEGDETKLATIITENLKDNVKT